MFRRTGSSRRVHGRPSIRAQPVSEVAGSLEPVERETPMRRQYAAFDTSLAL